MSRNIQFVLKLFLVFLLAGLLGMTGLFAQTDTGRENPILPPHGEEGDQPGSYPPITQQITLAQGSNWISADVEITLDDLKTALIEALGTNATITIKSQTQKAQYSNRRWVGQLSTLDVAQMYKVTVSNACVITLEGTPVNPQEHQITIKYGANWVAFPLDERMSLDTAFSGFAINGDKVKSQTANAQFNRGMWMGQLDALEPGQGFIYISKSAENRTLTFPAY
jgi:hypothetical protein